MRTVKNNISLIILTKNSLKTIERTIISAHNFVDEIVIVDNCSIDNTVTIAQKYTKNIYKTDISGDFSSLRNFALTKAKGEWIMILDSDEILSPELAESLSKLINNNEIEGYWFKRKTFISPDRYLKHGLFYPDYSLRLFRNGKGYKYFGKVHEQLNIPQVKTRQTDLNILHYPAHPKYTKFSDFKNLMPYIKIHAKEISSKKYPFIYLIFQSKYQFLRLFLGGYVRGKGFKDGWAGFRAQLMYASSISIAYIFALKRK